MRLHTEIESLKKRILALGAVVEAQLQMAVKSLETRDEKLAKQVIEGDPEIDQMEVDLEEECLKVLALHQPVAIDLRFIIAVLKINNDLERIGDLAVNIAERATFLAVQPRVEFPFDFSSMSDKVKSSGPFTITVDNVTHATLPYNPSLNVETSDTASY